MYKMHIYRDGALPEARQNFHSVDLHILRCSYWVLSRWNHTNLASPYWRLYWNKERGAQVSLGNERFSLEPQRMLLIAPSTPFTTRFSSRGDGGETGNVMQGCPAAEWEGNPRPYERAVHHFFIHFLAGAPFDRIAPQIIPIPLDEQLRALVHSLLDSCAHEPPTLTGQQSFALRALVYSSLASIPDALWPTTQTDERVLAVMRHIDENLENHLTNEDFARISSMNPKAFVRLFKAKTAQTPLAYLLQKRLEKASILLHHTDESIEKIADRCGFYDRHHFSKQFHRAYHAGPATYRKMRLF